MGLEVGGYHDSPDWPKLGPSLLIATCVILAIRTAKWPARFDEKLSHQELDHEIDYAAGLASRVLSRLMAKKEGIFPQKKVPWYQPTEDDCVQAAVKCQTMNRTHEGLNSYWQQP